MGGINKSFAAAMFAMYSLRLALSPQSRSHESGTFNYGSIWNARKKNRRGKIIRRQRSMKIK